MFRLTLLTVFLFAGCSKKNEAGGASGEASSEKGTVVGTLTPQEHKSPNGKITVKGPMPSAWKPREIANKGEMALAQPGGAIPPGQVSVSVEDYVEREATPETHIAKSVTSSKEVGYEIVVPVAEIAPGRWGYVGKMSGVQYKPGIDMFDGSVVWRIADRQFARCNVRWTGADATGALDLCKQLEVTAPPLAP